MAELMRETFVDMGLQVQWQQVEDGRANVLGTRAGTGGGPSLMFNGHMDTSYSGREPWLAHVPGLPAERVRRGRAAVRPRHLEHEGRARLLRRGAARARRRRCSTARRRDDRCGVRRDREDAVRRRAGRRVPWLRRRLSISRLARWCRRHVHPRRADRVEGRARALRLALAADLDAGGRSSTRRSAKGSATRTRSCACATSSTPCSSGSRPGRTTRRTRIAARSRS